MGNERRRKTLDHSRTRINEFISSSKYCVINRSLISVEGKDEDLTERDPFPKDCFSTVTPTERCCDQILIQILHFRIEVQILVIASVSA